MLALSALWLKKYGMKGIPPAVGLVASDTDSAGILYWMISYSALYKLPIRFMVLLGGLIALYRMFKSGLNLKSQRAALLYQVGPLCLVSCSVVGLALFRGQGAVIGFSELIWLGIPFFFLWIAGGMRGRRSDFFVLFVLIQGFVALAVILGKSSLADLNGASYAAKIGGEGWLVDPRDMINAPIAFLNFNKHDLSVMKFGHFHNPNSLGVYSAMLMVVSMFGMLKSREAHSGHLRWIVWLLPLAASIVLWMNSLTRGPVLLLLLWFLAAKLMKIRRRRVLLLLLFLGGVGLVGVVANLDQFAVLRYLIVQADDTSVVSRLGGYQFAFSAMLNHPLVGVPASPADPVPHILALKMATYYGIPTAVLMTVPFGHAIWYIFNHYSELVRRLGQLEMNYIISILCVLLGAMLTNGVVVYVLFWMAYGEILLKFDFFNDVKYNSFS